MLILSMSPTLPVGVYRFTGIRIFYMESKMKIEKGFTLIELLVVISIIALLLSILLPGLRSAKEMAKRVVCSTNLKSSGNGFYTFANDNDDELPVTIYGMSAKDGSGLFYANGSHQPFQAFRAFQLDLSKPEGTPYPDNILRWDESGNRKGWRLEGQKRMWGFGTLYDAGIVDTGEGFYCPSVPRKTQARHTYESYAQRGWPSRNMLNENDDIAHNVLTSYYYMPQDRKAKMSVSDNYLNVEVPRSAFKFTQINPNRIMSLDLMSNEYYAHKTGNKRGLNALYGDGSVSYSNDSEVFGHSVWDSENVNELPAVFRAVVAGIEGNTSYMRALPPFERTP